MRLRLLLNGILAALVLPVLLVPSAQAPVSAVTVTTDRTDYVLGMAVSVTVRIDYSASFTQIDEPALVEWFNATWVRVRAEYVAKVRISNALAEAVASWAPTTPGIHHVNASSNTTNGFAPVLTGSATLTVWDLDEYVIALEIMVATDRGGYERGENVTATANLAALGNVSRLERVEFNWYYPSGAPARLAVIVNVVNGEAVDVWAPDQVGSLYTVSAAYLGNDTVANATNFPVFPPTTLAANVTAGQSVLWDAARSPWRVCGELLVEASGTLAIEANVTVKFCRGSRLVVRGTLAADGSVGAPITFTSYEFPPAPGDWVGIRFEGVSESRLLGAIIEFAKDAVVAAASSPQLVGLTLRGGTGDAVNLTGSSATLRDTVITGFARGVRLRNATALVENVTISGHAREGVFVEGTASGSRLRDLRVAGGNYSLRAILAEGISVERADFAGAAIRAVDLTGSTATIANATIASAGQDFLLVASTGTLLNSTFLDDPAERTLITPSRLIVQNFLAVQVRTPGGAVVEAARVAVSVNGVPLPVRATDARGLAEWIVVEDRAHDAGGTVNNQIEVSVTRAGYSIPGSRVVAMATSHTETFLATPLSDPVGGVDLRVVAFGLFSVALLAFLLLVWGRRSRTREEDAAMEEPKPVPPLVADPGTTVAVLGEKPHAAFQKFAGDVRAGAPGLCITRIRPADARERYDLPPVPMHWLSRSFGEDTLNPTNLGAIVELVRKHIAGKPGGVVLLDGFEYLYTQNDFGKLVKFVQALADVAAEHKAVLLLPLDPRVLSEERRAVLLRDLRTWP